MGNANEPPQNFECYLGSAYKKQLKCFHLIAQFARNGLRELYFFCEGISVKFGSIF